MKRKPWRKYLVKSELNHLKEVHVRTKKDFVELNEEHNKRRNVAGALEPCYQCKTIANKLGLDVAARGKLVVFKEKEVRSMRIADIKWPILRRSFLCAVIVPCVVVVMVMGIWEQVRKAYEAGCETFADLWEGYNGKTSKGFD
jgi:hypothetical protein